MKNNREKQTDIILLQRKNIRKLFPAIGKIEIRKEQFLSWKKQEFQSLLGTYRNRQKAIFSKATICQPVFFLFKVTIIFSFGQLFDLTNILISQVFFGIKITAILKQRSNYYFIKIFTFYNIQAQYPSVHQRTATKLDWIKVTYRQLIIQLNTIISQYARNSVFILT